MIVKKAALRSDNPMNADHLIVSAEACNVVLKRNMGTGTKVTMGIGATTS